MLRSVTWLLEKEARLLIEEYKKKGQDQHKSDHQSPGFDLKGMPTTHSWPRRKS